MDINQILKQVAEQKTIMDGLNVHAEKMIKAHKDELENVMPNLFNDVSKMVKNNDFKGVKDKINQVRDASKRTDNQP